MLKKICWKYDKFLRLHALRKCLLVWWNMLARQLGIEVITTWKVSVFGVFLVRIQSECRKIRTRKTPNMDTLHAVNICKIITIFKGTEDLQCHSFGKSKLNETCLPGNFRDFQGNFLKNSSWQLLLTINQMQH